MRLVLTGYRGTGKTAIGRALSRELNLPFIDTDMEIEAHEGMTIPEIFDQRGESWFRKIEKEIIHALPAHNAVVSTGGGAILDPENVESLRADSTVILLSADPGTIIQRIYQSNRPPLTKLPLAEEVRHLLQIRDPIYRRVADYCFDTGRTEIMETVERILDQIRGNSIPFQDIHRILDMIPPLQPEDRKLINERFLGDCSLRLYGIIGNPVSHSRSPHLFNALFSHYHLPHRYIRLSSPSAETLLDLARIRNFRGLSVTIPHKQTVLPLIDVVDPESERIGAVNTIVFCGDRSNGYNTDWLGIRHPLMHLKGKRVAIVGAGGAAAAAIYACKNLGMQVTVLNRTPDRAVILAERFGCDAGPLSRLPEVKPDVVINATPVGMEPDLHSPIPSDWLRPGMTVFDLVYTPPLTPLLREARRRGCSIISGVEMFMHQAREQFQLFTGILPPKEFIQKLMA